MPTMVKQDKFSHDIRERAYKQYNYLYMNAKRIKIEFTDGSVELINLDDQNLSLELDQIIDKRNK